MPSPDLLHFLAYILLPFVTLVGSIIWWLVQRHMGALAKDNSRLAREKKAVNQKLQMAQEEINLVRSNLSQLRFAEERIEELREELEEAAATKATLQERLKTTEVNYIKLRDFGRNAKQALGTLEKERGAAQQVASEAQQLLDKQREVAEELEQKIETLMDEAAQLRGERDEASGKLETKTAALQDAQRQVFELNNQLVEVQAQMECAVEQNGRVWERPLAPGVPAFVPLTERGVPIISVINLKGGVGKTTLTANLGTMLGKRGKRVLMIDLDYQRSLSALCCGYDHIKTMHQNGRSLQHFLLEREPNPDRLIECIGAVKAARGCSIITTSESQHGGGKADSLEDAEMLLMARWMLGGTGPDVRFHLRTALHSPAIRERFDYVLLDCPPRLSTACINAVAASDYALIPLLLDVTSAISAPNLLRKLRRLQGCGVLANLGVLGVVANAVRLRGGKMVKAQATVWEEIRTACNVAWDEPVAFLESFIKFSSAVAHAADRHEQGKETGTFASEQKELEPMFTELVDEIEEKIDHERQRVAAVSA